jgi:hypothetical protein
MARKTTNRLATGALLLSSALVVIFPATSFAKNGNGKGAPPSSSALPVAAAPPPGIGATPIPWIDDANLMPSGAMSIDLSMSRWQGDGIGETTLPVVNFAVGLTDRFQFAVSVPRVVADEASGVAGGIGTTFVSGKYQAYVNDRGVKIAVAPTLELLGTNVLTSLGPDEKRAQFGLPVSLELDSGGRRAYFSSGWFSRGVWFAGAGLGLQVRPRVGVSASFSRSWTSAPAGSALLESRDKAEFSGGVGFALAPHVSVFASAAHTIATTPENGAGATVSAGMSFYIPPPARLAPARRPRP